MFTAAGRDAVDPENSPFLKRSQEETRLGSLGGFGGGCGKRLRRFGLIPPGSLGVGEGSLINMADELAKEPGTP